MLEVSSCSFYSQIWKLHLSRIVLSILFLILLQALSLAQDSSTLSGEKIPEISIQKLPGERIRLRSWIAEGRAIAALPFLEAYLKQFPGNSALLLLKGEAYYATEQFDQAANSFALGVQLEPAKLGELFNYGRALQSLDRHDEALVVFKAMQTRSEPALRVRGLFGEGLSLQSKDRQDQAQQKYEEVLKIDPQFDRARYRLAQIILDDDAAKALELLNRVLLFDPLHHGAAYNRALALRNLQRRDEAQQAMSRYQQILAGKSRIALLKERWAVQPENGPILLELGRAHRELAIYGEALRWFARAGAALPNAKDPLLESVGTLLDAGRPAEAQQLVERIGDKSVSQEAQKLIDAAKQKPETDR